jgi:hypothetical protein
MVLLTVSHGLERIGIKIVPYYITLELLPDQVELNLPPELKGAISGFLTEPEIERVYNEPEISGLRKEMHQWRDKDCLCFGLKHDEKVLSYMWCNLQRCNSDMASFPINKDEAFLFRARTMNAYRGKNLAPFLRYQLYKSLSEMGRIKYYSITEYFNTPAGNFKKKLNARPLKLCLFCGLFGKIKGNITIKNYRL